MAVMGAGAGRGTPGRGPGRPRSVAGSSTRSTVNTACAREGMPYGLPGEESTSMASKPSPSSRRSVLEPFGRAAPIGRNRSPSTHSPRRVRALTWARSAGSRPTAARLRAVSGAGQAGLADHRGQHRRLHRHGQGEPAGQAHADRAHPGTAALAVGGGGQGSQPGHHRAGRGRPGWRTRGSRTPAGSTAAPPRCWPAGRAARTATAGTRCSRPARSRRAKVTIPGWMPGISWMTITAGPAPARYTWVGAPLVGERHLVEPSNLWCGHRRPLRSG